MSRRQLRMHGAGGLPNARTGVGAPLPEHEEWCVAARAEKLATERLAADYKLAKEAAEDANRAAHEAWERGQEALDRARAITSEMMT
jgi:hypothetical protein